MVDQGVCWTVGTVAPAWRGETDMYVRSRVLDRHHRWHPAFVPVRDGCVRDGHACFAAWVRAICFAASFAFSKGESLVDACLGCLKVFRSLIWTAVPGRGSSRLGPRRTRERGRLRSRHLARVFDSTLVAILSFEGAG